jgi:DNA polymerase I-like protein with 3'-5' exonuclease and polymerase domains
VKRVVGDLEADGLLDTATRIWCGVFVDIDTGEKRVFRPDDIQDMPEYLDTVDALVMHNGIAYDKPLMEKVLGYNYKGSMVDTLIMSRLQRPDRVSPRGCKAGPHSVEAWGMRFGRAKPEHEDWSRFSEEMLHRCSEDVAIQRMILDALLDEGKGKNWKPAHKLSFKLFEILHKQEEYGWLIDREYMDKCIQQLTQWMDRIDRAVNDQLPMVIVRPTKNKGEYAYYKKPFKVNGELQSYVSDYLNGDWPDLHRSSVGGPFTRVGIRRVDLGSNKEVKDFLLSEGWVPRDWNTNDKGERTSPKLKHDDPFEGIQGKVGRLIARWVQCRHRRSQLEGWRELLREDSRLSQGISGIASTGRLKHKRIVNVPGSEVFYGKQMRQCFVSKPGFSIVGVDAAGCQNRMLAGRVGDPAYTKTLLEGRKEDRSSIHYVNQSAISRVAGFDPTYKVCKNLNYAFLFGASDNKLAATAGVDKGKGPRIREALFSVAPGLERLVEELTREWRASAERVRGRWGLEYRNGTVTGLDGRPVKIESEHCILVYTLQSDEAILMQYALVLLYQWLTERGWKHGREYGFVANVHDEIQAEVRDDLCLEYAELATQAIKVAGEMLGCGCEHKGEYDIGKNWHETH